MTRQPKGTPYSKWNISVPSGQSVFKDPPSLSFVLYIKISLFALPFPLLNETRQRCMPSAVKSHPSLSFFSFSSILRPAGTVNLFYFRLFSLSSANFSMLTCLCRVVCFLSLFSLLFSLRGLLLGVFAQSR